LGNTAKKMSEERGPKKPTPADQYVGVAVRHRRKELGLSQPDLAKAIGVTFQQLQKYEKGANRVSMGRLSAIAEALQVPMSYFFQVVDGTDNSAVKSKTLDLLKLPEASALLQHFSNIENPAVRRSVLKLARSLAGQDGDT
jgi:transcriptional regulator with XRE-family HTH domain